MTDVQGTQITATREGKVKTRDSQRFKKVETPQPPKFRTIPSSLRKSDTADNYESDADVGPARRQEARQAGAAHSAHEQRTLQPNLFPATPLPATPAGPPTTAPPPNPPAPQHRLSRKERWTLQTPEDWQRKRPPTRALARDKKSRLESIARGKGRK